MIRFILDESEGQWLPVIPKEIQSTLPADFRVEMDESNIWAIRDKSGKALYFLDSVSLDWHKVTIEDKLAVKTEEENSPDSQQFECTGANLARISGEGARVEVVNALIPLRSSPDALAPNILRPLPIGTPLEIIALPVCIPYLDGANLWWSVRTADGETGYAAEGSALSPTYYLSEIE